MKYPSRSEYCISIRNPKFAFRKKDPLTKIERDLDSALVSGKSVEKIKPSGIKELWSASGGYAIAFKYETFSPKKIWAIRCFYRANFDVKRHYQNALSHIKRSSCRSYFVDCSLLEEGIRVKGNCYPILKMEWVEGENIKKFIKANLGNKNKLKSLAERWRELSQKLLGAGIAHGDLQHGNVLIANRSNQLSLKLIDYDSLYFDTALNAAYDSIKGFPDYQHPLRKSLQKRCLEIDFFPQLVIYLSILALAEDRQLWETYKLDDREGLLFSSTDFQNPHQAKIFYSLSTLPYPIPTLANKLKQICQLRDFRNIPSLDAVLCDGQSPGSNQTRRWQLIPAVNLKRNSSAQVKVRSQKPVRAQSIQTSTHEPNTSSVESVVWDPRPYKAGYFQSKTTHKRKLNLLTRIIRGLFSFLGKKSP